MRPDDLNATVLTSLLLRLAGGPIQAQYTCVTNNGAITITGYTGPGGAVTIPGTFNDLPVTSIGSNAFLNTSITGVTIPDTDTVTNIDFQAFAFCSCLVGIALPTALPAWGTCASAGA